MVFSINAVESGPNNFAAFQQLAMQPEEDPPSGAGNSTDANGGDGGDTSAAVGVVGRGGNLDTLVVVVGPLLFILIL